jgi:hypothetical protein
MLQARPEIAFVYVHGSFAEEDRPFGDIDLAVYLDPLPQGHPLHYELSEVKLPPGPAVLPKGSRFREKILRRRRWPPSVEAAYFSAASLASRAFLMISSARRAGTSS